MAAMRVLVLGAGWVGKSVAEMLLTFSRGNYIVTLADREQGQLDAVTQSLRERLSGSMKVDQVFATRAVDASDKAQVREALKGHDAVVCMLPFNYVEGVAEAANELGVHYFDVTEDVETTEKVRAIDASGRAKVALVPQCGLAPGYIAIAAYELAKKLDKVHDLTLRVGALPQYPTNQLKYNVTWSPAGVVNEYCEPCNVMLNGFDVKVPALEGLERFSFEGVEYEAFYTSGGVGSLLETLVKEGRSGKNANIAYKTIRYPGHCELMKFLLHDLRLSLEHAEPAGPRKTRFDRQLLVDLFETSLPRTVEDVVVVFVNAIGEKSGKMVQRSFHRAVHAIELFGRTWTAIELTTAAGVCGMVDLHRLGKLPRKTGFIRQEECSLELFNSTVFGLGYEAPEKIEAATR
jgi:saccharopine dehydrogenase-like NADP-dependent oxidoreductase